MLDTLLKIFLVLMLVVIGFVIIDAIPMDEDLTDLGKVHESMLNCVPSKNGKIHPLKTMFFCPKNSEEKEK